MAKPALFTIDDDPEVLRVITRDLKRRYGDRYRIVDAESGHQALEMLERLRVHDEPVALLLADQLMPRLSGTEFLIQAAELHPKAKRVLLTAYADTAAAIEAINHARVDYYLLKPWHPPEDKLYPVLDDFLEDWHAGFRPAFQGLRLLAHRWSPEAHHLKNFLARNQVPYQWLDLETNPAAQRMLAEVELEGGPLPVVRFTDGTFLAAATPALVAERIGLRTRAETQFYDLAIVGGGPAGLAAAVYGASEGLTTLLIERQAPGGQAGDSSRIENYLGFPSGISGGELARRATTQAVRFGTEILCPQEVTGVTIDGPYRRVRLADGAEVACHALLVATGVSYRRLPAAGVDELTGAGVYYGAAAAEVPSIEGEDVFVVGGGNSAGQAAMFFAQHARRVTILIRGDSLTSTMSRYLIDQLADTHNVAIRTGTTVVEACGSGHLETLVLRSPDGALESVPAAGLFVFIGAAPHTGWLGDTVMRDAKGFILTGSELQREDGLVPGWPLERTPYLLETSIPGLFAAGDVRLGSMKRVASGVGEGSMAISFVHRYLATL